MRRGDIQRATAKLTKHSQDSAEAAVSTFRALFDTLVARYPGGYQLEVNMMILGIELLGGHDRVHDVRRLDAMDE